MLKYLAVCSLGLLGGGATRTEAIETGRRLETERTPLVPLVSIRELHEDFSGDVTKAKCANKPELVNSHEDVLVVAGECEGYKDFVVAAEMSTAARERGAEPAFPALYDPRFVKSDDTLSWRRRVETAGGGDGVAVVTGPDPKNCREAWCGGLGVLFIDQRTTGGARSGTRTTTARRTPTTSAATRTGESNPQTSRSTLTPRAHSFFPSFLLPPRLTYGD